MKKLLYILTILLVFSQTIFSQIYEPVKWETSVKKVSNTEYDLIVNATIDDGWHLYSQTIPEGGPIPTTFSFKDVKEKYSLVGNTIEDEGHEEFDKVFEMKIKYFDNETLFKQRIKLLTKGQIKINETVEFMVCDDTNCLPPTEEELTFIIPGETTQDESISLSEEKPESNEDAVLEKQTPLFNYNSDSLENQEDKINSKRPIKKEKDGNSKSKKGLWTIFIIAFFSGFAALLTPCVFPMIPMTVSFFTKQSKTKAKGIRNAIIYGLSIMAIYVLLGSLVTAIFGADSLNALSTNVWFNIIFFLLLVIFAISFFGAFELVLPSSWGTKVDSQADRGGIIGIMFMALALAIVSFSCTGPIVGTLLVEAASKGGTAPIVGMLGFSLAIALPFALFAAFPGWLNSLPKSGGWLNTVKVSLGFLELALAFKFLSNADLVLQLHLLEREVFLAIWIAIFGTFALYLLGNIRLPHDSKVEHISVTRLSFGLLVLTFTIYLIPGLWGAPLKIISGFPPPMQYSESPYGLGSSKSATNSSEKSSLPDGAKYGPHNIVTFLDYEKGLTHAKEVNKPVMIDFTGHACVNCRKMEERVWSDPRILNILKNDIVLISLYVDDKRLLPINDQYVSKTTGKKIKSIGNKWSDFQIEKYKANAQPYYVLINHSEENLIEYSAYDPDVESYLSWLQEGLSNFQR